MNPLWIDIPVLALVLFGIYRGLRSGIIMQVASLLGLIVGIWAGFRLAFIFANYYKNNFHLPEKAIPVAAFLTAFVLALLAVIFAGKLLKTVLEKTKLSMPDKAAGALFGAMKMAFLSGTIILLLHRSKIVNEEISTSSMTAKPIMGFAEGINEYSIGLVPKAKNVLTELDSFFLDLEIRKKIQGDSTTNDSPN